MKITFLHKAMSCLLLVTLCLTSCVSNKKLVYLQDKTQKNPEDALVDHSYELKQEPILLEKGDIISVYIDHVALTPGKESIESIYTEQRQGTNVNNPYLLGFLVSDSGKVHLPLVGSIEVAGKTVGEAQQAIKERANRMFSSSEVKVIILNFEITVLGEVGNPGTYVAHDNQANLFEALGSVKDLTRFADREEVRIVRTRNDSVRIFHLDLTDETLLATTNIWLHPRDVVLVKPLKRKRLVEPEVLFLLRGAGIITSVLTFIYAITRN